MKKRKILALLMAIMMIVTVFAACGGKDTSTETETTKASSASSEDRLGKNVNGSDVINATKVGEINEDDGYFYSYRLLGITYKDSEDNYGIMSHDGKKDTGIKYAFCQNLDNHYIVSESRIDNLDDIASVNKSGLADAEGNIVIPCEYAFYDELSDRYVQVFTATSRTATKPETDSYFFLSDDIVTFDADETDIIYLCTWKIFDLEKGAFVPGVEGKNNYYLRVYGKYIEYVDDTIGDYVTVDDNGMTIADNISPIGDEDWYTSYDENYNETVYDNNGNVVFSTDDLGYKISTVGDDYFHAFSTGSGASKYVLIDKTGKVATAGFDSVISGPYGPVLHVDDKLYNFDGTSFLDGTYEYVKLDSVFGKYLCLQTGDQYTFADTDGNVYSTFTKSDDLQVYTSNFSAYKKIGTDTYYYCMKDKDFTIKGTSVGPWLVETPSAEGEYLNDLVDTVTGATILSGYRSYIAIEADDGTLYIYAQATMSLSGKTMDVFVIEAK